MTEVSVEYVVRWDYLTINDEWRPRAETYQRRDHAELQYDTIEELERKYGTPRSPKLYRRTITTSEWAHVERHEAGT